MLPQSAAIGRFLARRFGLAGCDSFDEALVDAYIDFMNDHRPGNFNLILMKFQFQFQLKIYQLKIEFIKFQI